ncbi:MAG: hypothetical protein ABR596_01250 [Halarsenatibacteraceae bacterium]
MIGAFNAVGVFQLVVAVLVFGLIWYIINKKRLISEGKDEEKAIKKAKESTIQASVIFWAFFIVNQLGLFRYLFELIS